MDTRRLTVGSLKEHIVMSSVDVKTDNTWTKRYIKDKKHSKSIDVEQNNRFYTIIPKASYTLLNTALSQKQMLSFKCKEGTCGKCKVKVLKGMECLKEPTIEEDKKLQNKLNQDYRLACQAMIK